MLARPSYLPISQLTCFAGYRIGFGGIGSLARAGEAPICPGIVDISFVPFAIAVNPKTSMVHASREQQCGRAAFLQDMTSGSAPLIVSANSS